jgi:hypothetical protein
MVILGRLKINSRYNNKNYKIKKENNMEINNNKLFESMEFDFENGCGIVESLKINKVNRKDWKKVLKGYRGWELKEMGENNKWDKEEMDKKSLEFLKKNKIKWNFY